jgi:hypothetical protein
MRRRYLCIPIVAGLALVGAACGGDSSSLTKAEFAKQAEKICEKAKAREIAAFAASTAESQQKNLNGEAASKFIVDGALQPIEAMIDEIGELGTPNGDQGQVAEIVQAFESSTDKAQQDPAAALRSASVYRKADQVAARYGLTACSEF